MDVLLNLNTIMDFPDITNISVAITAVKELLGLAKSIRPDSTADDESKAALSELLGRLITTQTFMLDAQSKIHEVVDYAQKVTREVESYRNWEEDAAQYQLCEPYPGTIVYAPKPDVNAGQPHHYLCPNCFAKHVKSFLQGSGLTRECYPCNRSFQVKAGGISPPSRRTEY